MSTDRPDKVERSVENWARLFPGLPVDNLYVFSRMRLIIQGATIGRNAILKAHDLSEGEFAIIAILLRNNRPLSPTELAQEAFVSASGVTKRLKLLEQRKMIRKIENPNDKRAYSVELRPFVFNIMRPILAEISAKENALLADFAGPARAELEASLKILALRIEDLYPSVPNTAPLTENGDANF